MTVEFWHKFWTFLLPISIMVGTVILASIVSRLFRRILKRKAENLQSTGATNYLFLRHLAVGMVYIIGTGWALYNVPGFQNIAKTLVTSAGIIALIAGFASQHALANIVSGVFIIIFKPFRVGDRILLRDTMEGTVEDVTLRHTVIRDYNYRRIIVPNIMMSNEIVVNHDYHESRICRWVEMGIAYTADVKRAKAIMQEEALAHPLQIDVRTPHDIEEGVQEVNVRVIDLLDSAVLLRAWVWAENAPDAFILKCDLLERIKERFDQEGIEIPYPYRSVVLKQELPPEQLRTDADI